MRRTCCWSWPRWVKLSGATVWARAWQLRRRFSHRASASASTYLARALAIGASLVLSAGSFSCATTSIAPRPLPAVVRSVEAEDLDSLARAARAAAARLESRASSDDEAASQIVRGLHRLEEIARRRPVE